MINFVEFPLVPDVNVYHKTKRYVTICVGEIAAIEEVDDYINVHLKNGKYFPINWDYANTMKALSKLTAPVK